MAILAGEAKTLDANSRIRISHDVNSLRVYDECTGTTSFFPVNELDDDVRVRLTGRKPPDGKRQFRM
ncbi:MAG: hypothetical protein KGQ70_04730 [Alphaproteobacteria bacterium]|nr:hypothetical protein [Alphaproteobacteria bacterium]